MTYFDSFNGFDVSIDWLEFTVFDTEIVSVCNKFGLDFYSFDVQSCGALGYKRYAKNRDASLAIFWDGTENMGCHVRVTGSAMPYFFHNFVSSITSEGLFGPCIEVDNFDTSLFSLLFSLIRENGKISRVDLALDDYTGDFFSTNDIIKLLSNSQCVSTFRSFEVISRYKICDSGLQGQTVYFGSRKSDVMLRVYDKKLQKKDDSVDSWIRWELELKNDYANFVVDEIVNRNCIGSLFSEILNDRLRFIVLDKAKRTNCSLHPVWQSFIGTLEKCHLKRSQSFKTILSKAQWFERQCLPTLAGLCKYNDGDMSFIYDKLDFAYERNTQASKYLFEGVLDYVVS